MAVYGVDFYGTELYGIPQFVEFSANPFRVTPAGYGVLRLDWTPPSGNWTALRVLRNSYGPPDFETDGLLLGEYTPSSGTSEILDTNLREGRFYYYSVFVFDADNSVWRRAATGFGLSTQDHGYSDTMFSWIPSWFQDQDNDLGDSRVPAETYSAGPLKRYLKLPGLAADFVRSEQETLRELRNPDRLAGNSLPFLADHFGVPFEPAVGMRRTRFWTRDAVSLYRRKGTLPGIREIVTTITGWNAEVRYNSNLLKGTDAAAWRLISGDSVIDLPDESDIELVDLVIEVAGTTWEISSKPEGFARFTALPVEDATYTFQVDAKLAAGSETVTASIHWLDEDGDLVSTDSTLETVGSEWTTLSVPATRPAGVVFAEMRVEGSGTTKLRRKKFEQGSGSAGHRPPMGLDIFMKAARSNLVFNPNFEASLFTWSVEGGTINRTEFRPTYTGSFVLEVTDVTTPGVPAVVSGGPYPLNRDQVFYAVSGYSSDAGTRARIVWLDEAQDVISTTSWGSTAAEGSWHRAHASGIAPSGALFAKIEFELALNASLDAVLLDESESPDEYFDGNFFGADYLWSGDANASQSLYYPARTVRDFRLRKLLVDWVPIGQGYRFIYIAGSAVFLTTTSDEALGIGVLGLMYTEDA